MCTVLVATFSLFAQLGTLHCPPVCKMRGGVVLTCVAKQCDLAMNSSSNGSYLFVLDLSVDCWSPGLDFYDSVQTPTKDDSTPREMAPKIPKYVRSDVDERA